MHLSQHETHQFSKIQFLIAAFLALRITKFKTNCTTCFDIGRLLPFQTARRNLQNTQIMLQDAFGVKTKKHPGYYNLK
jgi:hypothetical protein